MTYSCMFVLWLFSRRVPKPLLHPYRLRRLPSLSVTKLLALFPSFYRSHPSGDDMEYFYRSRRRFCIREEWYTSFTWVSGFPSLFSFRDPGFLSLYRFEWEVVKKPKKKKLEEGTLQTCFKGVVGVRPFRLVGGSRTLRGVLEMV